MTSTQTPISIPNLTAMNDAPICHDLYCGLGGWAEGFLSEGFRCIGYDIEKHDYGTGTYPGELILQDILTLNGAQLKNATVIIASPPCTEPSYRAMPWKRAKALNAAGPPHKFIALFEACFRIQREASEAAGQYIPIIVENVCGAQRWVGRARWHFGSYYLWGDVPALMPITFKPKVNGQNWSRYTETGEVSPHWRLEGLKANTHGESIKNTGGSWFNVAHNTTSGKNRNPVHEGTKQGGDCFGETGPGQLRSFRSKSRARARASAEIAKIPFPLAQHIAKCFLPVTV